MPWIWKGPEPYIGALWPFTKWWNIAMVEGSHIFSLRILNKSFSCFVQLDCLSPVTKTSTRRFELRRQEKIGGIHPIYEFWLDSWNWEVGRGSSKLPGSGPAPFFVGGPGRLLPLWQHSFLIYKMRIGLNLGVGGSRLLGIHMDGLFLRSHLDISIDSCVLNVFLSLDQITRFLAKPWLP